MIRLIRECKIVIVSRDVRERNYRDNLLILKNSGKRKCYDMHIKFTNHEALMNTTLSIFVHEYIVLPCFILQYKFNN